MGVDVNLKSLAAGIVVGGVVAVAPLLYFGEWGQIFGADDRVTKEIPGTGFQWMRGTVDGEPRASIQFNDAAWLPWWVLEDPDALRVLGCNLYPCDYYNGAGTTERVLFVQVEPFRDDVLNVALAGSPTDPTRTRAIQVPRDRWEAVVRR
jgi:hypothetical protein